MTPLDPVQPAKTDAQLHMGPDYLDENPNLDLVEQGLDVADDEAREESVIDDPDAETDFAAGEEADESDEPLPAPEVAAIHVDTLVLEEDLPADSD